MTIVQFVKNYSYQGSAFRPAA